MKILNQMKELIRLWESGEFWEGDDDSMRPICEWNADPDKLINFLESLNAYRLVEFEKLNPEVYREIMVFAYETKISRDKDYD